MRTLVTPLTAAVVALLGPQWLFSTRRVYNEDRRNGNRDEWTQAAGKSPSW